MIFESNLQCCSDAVGRSCLSGGLGLFGGLFWFQNRRIRVVKEWRLRWQRTPTSQLMIGASYLLSDWLTSTFSRFSARAGLPTATTPASKG